MPVRGCGRVRGRARGPGALGAWGKGEPRGVCGKSFFEEKRFLRGGAMCRRATLLLCLALLLAPGARAACRVIVHDDDENSPDDMMIVLQHLGLSLAHSQKTVDQIMRRGEAVVLESTDARACAEAVSSLTQFGLSASSDEGPGTVRLDPNNIDDLVRAL